MICSAQPRTSKKRKTLHFNSEFVKIDNQVWKAKV